jgi:hypothetical protein
VDDMRPMRREGRTVQDGGEVGIRMEGRRRRGRTKGGLVGKVGAWPPHCSPRNPRRVCKDWWVLGWTAVEEEVGRKGGEGGGHWGWEGRVHRPLVR